MSNNTNTPASRPAPSLCVKVGPVAKQRWRGLLGAYCLLAFSAVVLPVKAETFRVMAAASLQPALTEIAQAISETSDHTIVPIFASSGTLARQISQGAPADLYISANTRWADWVVDDLGLPADTGSTLLSNALVVVSTSKDADPGGLTGLGDDAIIAIGDPAHVPAGHYAQQSLQSLKLWQQLRSSMVFTASVRVALTFAERGEVDAAIIYRSDASTSSKVKILEVLPENSHPPIQYRMISLSAKGDILADLLHSNTYGSIFEKHGFVHFLEP